MNYFSQYKLIIISAIFFVVFYNFSFFDNVIKTYPFEGINVIYILSMVILLTFLLIFLFTLLSSKYTTKPLLIILFIFSSFTSYFMNTYNIVIDDGMIRNSLQTNFNESLDLFSFKLLGYLFFLAIIPSYFVYKIDLDYDTLKNELYSKFKTLFISLVVILIIVFSFSKFYTSFFREHKALRFHVNPIYWMYSAGSYLNKTFNNVPIVVKEIGKDAKINSLIDKDKTQITIMVLGEASRADRFSLNGYEKETNPLLKKEEIINFSNMYSCGTSTAESVPCMFSIFGQKDYDYKKGISTENVLDVLTHTNDVKVLWRDNNSDSKGVALRVDFEDYRTPRTNTKCDDVECRDEGMLVGLEDYIKNNQGKNIFIVLHQMGNHGPAYYKRYPKEFEKFTPVCKSNQLETCTKEEVSNAYDNAILYTDYFLSKVINFLKPYSKDYKTAMLYMSDHGESLGENGIYLHGLPYFIAPNEQKHIGSLMWFGEEYMNKSLDIEKLNSYKNQSFSQDNLFHTLLGFFEVETNVYKKEMDILSNARK